MCESPLIISSICERKCPTRWCCSVNVLDSPPPLCDHEVRRIAAAGHADFYETDEEGAHLKVKPNGYCTFFDDEEKRCGIYHIRPFDCRLFPLDFIPGKTEGRWVIYDCPLSRTMKEADIEIILECYEREYAAEIAETWDYDAVIARRSDIRILRKVDIVLK